LLLPKVWSYVLLLRDRRRLASCGGGLRALASVLIETFLSILIAPIMMAFHVVFVTSTLLGLNVAWSTQERCERGQRFWPALAAHWKQTVAGLAAAVIAWVLAPPLLPWLAPVLVGLILAVPLSMALSSIPLGQALARRRILVTPAETVPPRILRRLRQLLAQPVARELAEPRVLFGRLLGDPAFAALHRCILAATGAEIATNQRQLHRAVRLVRAGALQQIPASDRRAVQSDPLALKTLQLIFWMAPRQTSPRTDSGG
jgi:membrane glycosyltransferase